MREIVYRLGERTPRCDALTKVTGREPYASDFVRKDMLWAALRRGGVPHARIRGIGTDRARALPGVVGVLTHRDIQGPNRQGIVRKDHPILADTKIRQVADPVALVIAEGEAILGPALQAITLDLEALPGVFDMDEALAPGAPLIHEESPTGNLLLQGEIVTGDGSDALGRAFLVVEATFELSQQAPAPLETEGGWAILRENGRIEITVSTQSPFRDRWEVAEALGISQDRIRILAPFCGGAFGAKDGMTVQTFLALAAMAAGGRPVRMVWEREENLLAGVRRHACRARYRLGVSPDGAFQALEAQITYDTGPYDHLGGAVMALGLEHAPGPYRIPHLHLQAKAVYTNNPLAGPMRGFGVPQVTAAMEQVVDLAAQRLGMDPLAIRRRNALCPGETTALGVSLLTPAGILPCLQTLESHPLWLERPPHGGPLLRRGVGLASLMHAMGYGPIIPDEGRAKVELTPEGRIRVFCGVVDMGQGNAATCLQIVGDLLDQPLTTLALVLPDTDRTLPSGSSTASRTTYTYGNALVLACRDLRQRILFSAGEVLGLSPEGLTLLPGAVAHPASGTRLPLARIAEAIPPGERVVTSHYKAPVSEARPSADPVLALHGLPHALFSFGVHLASVEVDMGTGRIRLLRYLAVMDCGRILNPTLFEQQIQGSIAQGIGYALMEEMKAEKGRTLACDLSSTRIPTALDLPSMDILSVGVPSPESPLGMKGAGEIAMNGPLAAIANAVQNACGVRLARFPMTPERVLAALGNPRPPL